MEMEQQDSNFCMIRGLARGLRFRVEGFTVKKCSTRFGV